MPESFYHPQGTKLKMRQRPNATDGHTPLEAADAAIQRPRHHEPRDPVPTGVHLLDIALPDGIPSGSLVLSLGTPACGFELVAKEFAAADHPVLYYSPDESADEVEAVVRRFDEHAEPTVVDLASRYYDHIVRTQSSTRATTVAPIGPNGAPPADDATAGLPDFLQSIFEEIRASRPNRTIIDTLDFFFEVYTPEEVVRSLRALRLANRDIDGLLYVSKMRDTVDPKVEALLEHVADVVLEFRRTDATIEDIHLLNVKKVRNEPQYVGTTGYKPTRDGRLVRDTRNRI